MARSTPMLNGSVENWVWMRISRGQDPFDAQDAAAAGFPIDQASLQRSAMGMMTLGSDYTVTQYGVPRDTQEASPDNFGAKAMTVEEFRRWQANEMQNGRRPDTPEAWDRWRTNALQQGRSPAIAFNPGSGRYYRLPQNQSENADPATDATARATLTSDLWAPTYSGGATGAGVWTANPFLSQQPSTSSSSKAAGGSTSSSSQAAGGSTSSSSQAAGGSTSSSSEAAGDFGPMAPTGDWASIEIPGAEAGSIPGGGGQTTDPELTKYQFYVATVREQLYRLGIPQAEAQAALANAELALQSQMARGLTYVLDRNGQPVRGPDGQPLTTDTLTARQWADSKDQAWSAISGFLYQKGTKTTEGTLAYKQWDTSKDQFNKELAQRESEFSRTLLEQQRQFDRAQITAAGRTWDAAQQKWVSTLEAQQLEEQQRQFDRAQITAAGRTWDAARQEWVSTLEAQQLAQAKELAQLNDKLQRDVEAGRIDQQGKDRELQAEIQRRGLTNQEAQTAIEEGRLALQQQQAAQQTAAQAGYIRSNDPYLVFSSQEINGMIDQWRAQGITDWNQIWARLQQEANHVRVETLEARQVNLQQATELARQRGYVIDPKTGLPAKGPDGKDIPTLEGQQILGQLALQRQQADLAAYQTELESQGYRVQKNVDGTFSAVIDPKTNLPVQTLTGEIQRRQAAVAEQQASAQQAAGAGLAWDPDKKKWVTSIEAETARGQLALQQASELARQRGYVIDPKTGLPTKGPDGKEIQTLEGQQILGQLAIQRGQLALQEQAQQAALTGKVGGERTLEGERFEQQRYVEGQQLAIDNARLAEAARVADLNDKLQRDVESGKITQQQKELALQDAVQQGQLAVQQQLAKLQEAQGIAALTGKYGGERTLAGEQAEREYYLGLQGQAIERARLAEAARVADLNEKLQRDVESGKITQQQKELALQDAVQRGQLAVQQQLANLQEAQGIAALTGKYGGERTLAGEQAEREYYLGLQGQAIERARLAEAARVADLNEKLQRDVETGRISQQEKDRQLQTQIQQGQLNLQQQQAVAAMTGKYGGERTLEAERMERETGLEGSRLRQARDLAEMQDTLQRWVTSGQITQQEADRALRGEIERAGLSVEQGRLAIEQGQLALAQQQQTFAQRMQESQLTGKLGGGGERTLEGEQAERNWYLALQEQGLQRAAQEAGLTGAYGGTPTFTAEMERARLEEERQSRLQQAAMAAGLVQFDPKIGYMPTLGATEQQRRAGLEAGWAWDPRTGQYIQSLEAESERAARALREREIAAQLAAQGPQKWLQLAGFAGSGAGSAQGAVNTAMAQYQMTPEYQSLFGPGRVGINEMAVTGQGARTPGGTAGGQTALQRAATLASQSAARPAGQSAAVPAIISPEKADFRATQNLWPSDRDVLTGAIQASGVDPRDWWERRNRALPTAGVSQGNPRLRTRAF